MRSVFQVPSLALSQRGTEPRPRSPSAARGLPRKGRRRPLELLKNENPTNISRPVSVTSERRSNASRGVQKAQFHLNYSIKME